MFDLGLFISILAAVAAALYVLESIRKAREAEFNKRLSNQIDEVIVVLAEIREFTKAAKNTSSVTNQLTEEISAKMQKLVLESNREST